MKGSLARWCIPLLVALGPAIQVHADIPSPFRADVSLTGFYGLTGKSASRERDERQLIPAVRLSGRIRGEGRIDGRFTIRRNKTWQSLIQRNSSFAEDKLVPVLLQGKLAIGRPWRSHGTRVFPGAATIINNRLEVSFPGKLKGSRASRQRIYTLRMWLDGSLRVSARVSSIPAFIARRGACAEVAVLPKPSRIVPPLAAAQVSPDGSVSVVTISTDADAEWYTRYGEESNAVIAGIINTAEVLYERELNIRFRIVKQHVYTGASPYTSNDPGTLLTQFSGNPDNPINLGGAVPGFASNVDLKHLFTGKDLDGSVVGIAYIGVVCAAPSLSYGITQHYLDPANPGIFAHEVGHNFGANHDTSDTSGLMFPSISVPPADHFSGFSMSEIGAHLAQHGACLSSEPGDSGTNPDPSILSPDAQLPPGSVDPSDAVLSVAKRRVGEANFPVVRLLGRLSTLGDTPYEGATVRLIAGETEVGEALTDALGRYEFFVRVAIPRGQRLMVHIEAVDGLVQSNTLFLQRTSPKPTTSNRRQTQGYRSRPGTTSRR